MGLRRYDDGISAYKNGLEIDPNNEALNSGLAAAASRTRFTSPFGDVFAGSEMWARLESDPTTRAFLHQDDFKNKMLDVQENPSTLNRHLKDPRIMQALGVLLNVKLWRPNSSEDADIPDAEMTEEEPEPEDMDVPEEEREARERKKEAHKEKEKGNAAFEVAIQHYAKAIELDDRAVVYLEMGQVDFKIF